MQALFAMLQREPDQRPTAIICYNDELAVKMLDIVRQAGLTVPEDLSIVGFDDANLATATEVKLTTVAHPKTEMGTDAVELLLSMLDKQHQRRQTQDKIYDPQLVIRDSTRPPQS